MKKSLFKLLSIAILSTALLTITGKSSDFTVIQVNGRITSGAALGNGPHAVSWSQNQTYANANIYVSLFNSSLFPIQGKAFLSMRLGPGSSAADLVAETKFELAALQSDSILVFAHADLKPGTYYLIVQAPDASWSRTSSPEIQVDSGVMQGGMYYAPAPGPYAPGSTFLDYTKYFMDALLFRVENADITDPNCSFKNFSYTTFNSSIAITGYTGSGGSVAIPSNINGLPVATIWMDAFKGAANMTFLAIPDTIKSIGLRAFDGCTNLANIFVDARNTEYSSVDGVLFDKKLTTLIKYPAGKAGSYTIPGGVSAIDEYAAQGSALLTSVTIPNSVIKIRMGAFNGCASLTEVCFDGNAPNPGGDLFTGAAANITVFYRPGAKGWGSTFAGCPARPFFIEVTGYLDSGVMLEGAPFKLWSHIEAGPSPSIQWYFNGQPVDGGTNAILLITSASTLNIGDYGVIASNLAGVVTNGPVQWGVNNVTASNFFGLVIADASGPALQVQSSDNIGGPWTFLAELTLTDNPQTFIDFTATNAAHRFYRTIPPARIESWVFKGWSLASPTRSQNKIEFVDGEVGFYNWQFLSYLTLSSSPYQFIDTTETNKLPRYYRTTMVP